MVNMGTEHDNYFSNSYLWQISFLFSSDVILVINNIAKDRNYMRCTRDCLVQFTAE